jgi:hypothetical protein
MLLAKLFLNVYIHRTTKTVQGRKLSPVGEYQSLEVPMVMFRHKMKWVAVLLLSAWLCPGSPLAATEETAPGRKMALQATKTKQLWITADHSKHPALQQEFSSGPEVTQACLSCHSEAAAQFHKTIHWTWRDPATVESKVLGKGGLSINNF